MKWRYLFTHYHSNRASQVAVVVKNLPVHAGDIRDMGSIPGSGRFPRGGHGNPLQYSSLEYPKGREAWRATVHGVTKNWASERLKENQKQSNEQGCKTHGFINHWIPLQASLHAAGTGRGTSKHRCGAVRCHGDLVLFALRMCDFPPFHRGSHIFTDVVRCLPHCLSLRSSFKSKFSLICR